MKISKKISILVLFLLLILGLNTYIGIVQITRIDRELKDVVNKNIFLTEVVTSIMRYQLKKTVLLERMIRISEEMAYDDVSPARQKHLIDSSKFVKKGFDECSQKGAEKIVEGKKIIEERLAQNPSGKALQELKETEDYLHSIEKAHIQYDNLISKLFDAIQTETYQISFQDNDGIRRVDTSLTKELNALLEAVQGFTRDSLHKARTYEQTSRKILRDCLMISIIFGLIIAGWIIRGVSRPLEKLEKATKQVGSGNFAVHIEGTSHDEIGEVSQAFNTMAGQLSSYKKDIENKNKELAESLEITETQKKDLEKVNKELDRFAYTVSHDLRAPLTGISGYAGYLEKKFFDQLDNKGKSCIQGIQRGAFRMNALINDLLALTKISRIKNPYEDVPLKEILDPIWERMEFTIKELNVEMVIPQELPVIRCDRIKLGEVFLNLINNAIKFSSKRQDLSPKVEIGYEDKGDYHQFSVKDNGIGIDKEFHNEVFGVFKRLHTSQEYEGTGAGLNIVKSVVEDHNGKVWIDSELGRGATFYFTIAKDLER